MRHLTSGSAGRGVDGTKRILPFSASRAFLGAGSSRPTTVSGVRAHGSSKRCKRWWKRNRATLEVVGVPLFISHRWYRLRRRVFSIQWGTQTLKVAGKEGALCGSYHSEEGVGEGWTLHA